MNAVPAELRERLRANLTDLRRRIAAAALASGRSPAAVRLVAVTKYVSAPITRALVEAGCSELGESRPQDLWIKAAALADLPVQWHFIGHLQRNKLRRTLPLVTLLHSIDSLRLLAAIEQECAAAGRMLDGLLEVNISGETSKHGLAPSEIEPVVEQLGAYPHVRIRGLMAMAGLAGGTAEAERHFAALRSLRDRLAANAPAGVTLDELSIGMSGDFEAAIRQGATLVRIGSALTAGCDDLPAEP